MSPSKLKMLALSKQATHAPSAVDPSDDSPLFFTDSFRMFCFKVLPCSKRFVHDWVACPFAHPGEKARRRDPRCHSYASIACPETKQGRACPRGDNCAFSHNIFEFWLHPTRYRTQLCNDGAACFRKSCFFAHSCEQLRSPTNCNEACSHALEPMQSMRLQQGTLFPADLSAAAFHSQPSTGSLSSFGEEDFLSPPPPHSPASTRGSHRHDDAFECLSAANAVQQQQQHRLQRQRSASEALEAGGPRNAAAARQARRDKAAPQRAQAGGHGQAAQRRSLDARLVREPPVMDQPAPLSHLQFWDHEEQLWAAGSAQVQALPLQSMPDVRQMLMQQAMLQQQQVLEQRQAREQHILYTQLLLQQAHRQLSIQPDNANQVLSDLLLSVGGPSMNSGRQGDESCGLFGPLLDAVPAAQYHQLLRLVST